MGIWVGFFPAAFAPASNSPLWSCSQIVVRVKLAGRPELIAIHIEADDGIVHEHGFRETHGFASSALDAGP
jgi:hypothetical protein